MQLVTTLAKPDLSSQGAYRLEVISARSERFGELTVSIWFLTPTRFWCAIISHFFELTESN